MGSSTNQNPLYDVEISSVTAGLISGHNASQELTAMDLAMKLHYLRFVYYFNKTAFEGFNILMIKETMFNWLNYAYVTIGRLRRTESGRPFIKCNDSGMRIIEAKCHLTLEEWLKSKDDSRHKLLVSNQVLGPDLEFTPLVLMQLTTFKCGGTSVGMSWSHVLGDTFSAVDFINLWAQVIAGHHPAHPLKMAQHKTLKSNEKNQKPNSYPNSITRVGPVGELWSISNNNNMETFSFYITMSALIRSKIFQEKANQPVFECICVMILQCLKKVSGGSIPKFVTICRNDPLNRVKGIITNECQTISLVKLDDILGKCTSNELVSHILNNGEDERIKIEEAMERDNELPDFLIYGANLTFVDLTDVSFYDMEVKGHKPEYVNCFIDNIGDEGVVLVLPTPNGCSNGRIVSITLPKDQLVELKLVLNEDWSIV